MNTIPSVVIRASNERISIAQFSEIDPRGWSSSSSTFQSSFSIQIGSSIIQFEYPRRYKYFHINFAFVLARLIDCTANVLSVVTSFNSIKSKLTTDLIDFESGCSGQVLKCNLVLYYVRIFHYKI